MAILFLGGAGFRLCVGQQTSAFGQARDSDLRCRGILLLGGVTKLVGGATELLGGPTKFLGGSTKLLGSDYALGWLKRFWVA